MNNWGVLATELQDPRATAQHFNTAEYVIETVLTETNIDKLLIAMEDPPLTLREHKGLDKSMQTTGVTLKTT